MAVFVTAALFTEGRITHLPLDWNEILLEAAAQGNMSEIQRAVEAGADVNACSEQGVTVLMRAVRRGDDLKIIRYLVEHGANVLARDKAGKIALDYLTFPEEPPEHWENAHEAWAHSEENYISDYLERVGGVKPSSIPVLQASENIQAQSEPPAQQAKMKKSKKISTASGLDWMLFAAIQRGDLAGVESIIETDKVNLNARDDWGWTPLMQATYYNHIEIIRLLLNNGADPAVMDEKGTTVLSIAGPEAKAVIQEFIGKDK